ncbi:MAG: hypothetical protein PVG60_06150 [Desulfarculaceae bacterium]
MDEPKKRDEQFTQERKTKLKLRDNEKKNGNAKESLPKAEEEAQKKQSDADESHVAISNHAEQIHEYHRRQMDKAKGIKHPRVSNEESHNPKKIPGG